MKLNTYIVKSQLKRLLVLATVAILPFAATSKDQGGESGPGQATTLMQDGTWLLTGGSASRNAATSYDMQTQRVQRLPDLKKPRAWHTATMMPSGEVLLLGGLDEKNNLVSVPEFFDLATQSFTQLPALPLLARAAHTATVLTDGRLLIIGGVNKYGKALTDVELWNPATNDTEQLGRGLSTGRYQQTATLLADGSVVVWGGKSDNGRVLTKGERFDPKTNAFEAIDRIPEASTTVPEVAGTLPVQGAIQVPLDAQPALRLNRPLDVKTVSASTLTLTGPTGIVATKVIAAESGSLIFITPNETLKPDTQYRILLNAPADTKGYPLTGAPISFTTAKSGSLNNANKKSIGANLSLTRLLPPARNETASNAGSIMVPNGQAGEIREMQPAVQMRPPLRAGKGVTAVSGVVMTQQGQPLPRVRIELVGTRYTTRTNNTGRFLLQGIPAGKHELWIDARPASYGHKTYGTFIVAADVQRGKTYVLPYISWMPEIDTATEVQFDSPTKKEVVLTSPKIPGMEVRIPAGTIIRDHAGKRVTKLSLTPIPVDRPPFPLPTTFAVPVYFTVQPGGAVLYKADGSYAIARVIYPNYTHRAIGARVEVECTAYTPSARL